MNEHRRTSDTRVKKSLQNGLANSRIRELEWAVESVGWSEVKWKRAKTSRLIRPLKSRGRLDSSLPEFPAKSAFSRPRYVSGSGKMHTRKALSCLFISYILLYPSLFCCFFCAALVFFLFFFSGTPTVRTINDAGRVGWKQFIISLVLAES